MKNSFIFVGSEEHIPKRCFRNLFKISLRDLSFRIYASFVPPLSKRFQKVHIDLLGPLVSFIIFNCLLQYGHNNKNEVISFSPVKFSLLYLVMVPVICKLLLNISQSTISWYELLSLLGYALYGHLLSLGVSMLLFDERSTKFFFLCLITFSGLSTFRLAIILLKTIPKPAARLLVCSFVSAIQMLSLIFVHFAYMHKTYTYGRQTGRQ